jgi:hypothetical protein
MPRPWQYNNPMPLFQSQNTFNQAAPPPPQQQPSGGGPVGAALPNFDQNGRIVSIPQGVSWNPTENRWDYGGALRPENANNAGNNWFNGAIPIEQYTGTLPPNPYVNTPENPLGATPWLGVGGFHAARGGAVEGGSERQPSPFLRRS